MSLSFQVSEACRELGLRPGAILFREVCVGPSDSNLRAEIDATAASIADEFSTLAQIRRSPPVQAFAEILRRVGVNPRKQSPTVESLLKRALKQGTLPAINNLVDAYNLVSVRCRCSLGAHDLDPIALPVALRPLTGDETFTPLGGAEAVPLESGAFGYVDSQQRVLCWLDVQQSEFSKVTRATRNVLLIVEGTAEHPPDALDQALADAVETVQKQCGGTAEVVARCA